MSSLEKRKIFFTNDLDGVHFKSPPPIKTLIELLRGNLKVPDKDRPIGKYPLPIGLTDVFFRRISILSHKYRSVNPLALEGLDLFKEFAENYQREILFAALSGRELDKHQMTYDVLSSTGHMKYFGDLFLSQGKSASRWKETVVTQLTKDGFNVVHIDDDIRAGLCVARVDQGILYEPRVWVYLIKNISNHPTLLNRSGIVIPSNLVFVKSFKDAAYDFGQKLREGYL